MLQNTFHENMQLQSDMYVEQDLSAEQAYGEQ